MPLQRKINRTRSIARMKPYGAQRTAGSVANKVKSSPKATANAKAKNVARKATAAPKLSDKPKATGRPGMKRVPAPAMTTNKKKVY